MFYTFIYDLTIRISRQYEILSASFDESNNVTVVVPLHDTEHLGGLT